MPPAEMPQLHLAVRLRLPYDNLRQVFSDWALRVQRLVVYEHPEKDNVHCHALLMNVSVSENTLRGDIRKHGLPLKGAGQLSFKTTFKNPEKQVVAITDESAPQFITYMSKGKYDPKYYTGYDEEFIASRRALWVDYKRRSADEILCDLYEKAVQEHRLQAVPFGSITDDNLKRIAVDVAIAKYKVFNIGARRDAKMLLDTYRYKFKLIDPAKLKLPFE